MWEIITSVSWVGRLDCGIYAAFCMCVVLILEYISIEVDRREFPAAERGAEGHKFSADRRRQAGDEHQWDVLEHRRHSESLAWTERHVLR